MKSSTSVSIQPHHKFEHFLGESPFGVAIVTRNHDDTLKSGKRVFANEALAKMFGFSSESSFIAAPIETSWVSPKRLEEFESLLAKGEKIVNFEASRYRRDGRIWWVLLNTQPIVFKGQDCDIVWHTDVTNRHIAEQARIESEDRFRDFAEISSDWLWETDADGRIIWESNSPGSGQSGRPFSEIEGMTREEIAGELMVDDEWISYRQALTKQTPIKEFEYRYRGQDGDIHFARIDGKAVFDKYGQYLGFRGVATDISEQKLSSELLRNKEAMFASIINNLPTELAVKDLNGRYKILNPQFAKRFGINVEDVLGRRITDLSFVPKDYAEKITQQDKEIHETREVIIDEFSYIRPDGEHATELVIKFPVINAKGAVTGVGTVATDITALKRAEDEVIIRDTWLDAIFENAPNEIVFKDTEGRITAISRSVANTFGKEREDFIGRTTADFLPDHIADTYMVADREVLKSGELLVQEIAEEADGKTRHSLSAKFPVRDNSGIISGVCSITTDLTELRQTDEARRQALQDAQQANRSKSEFLANMSHELRTPLNAILGFSEMISSEILGPHDDFRYGDYATAINVSGTHLLQIISDILDISKIEAGETSMEESSFSVDKTVLSCVSMIEARAKEAGVALKNQVQNPLPMLHADQRHIKQVVINLLSNALKFTPAGGQVFITAQINDRSGIEIAITDTGIGIDAENIPKILTPFGQVAESQKRNHEGTGLGLPICVSLMELHGGELAIESEVDKGTLVTLRFPRERTVCSV
jgi:PAS domain S-box-containing protein